MKIVFWLVAGAVGIAVALLLACLVLFFVRRNSGYAKFSLDLPVGRMFLPSKARLSFSPRGRPIDVKNLRRVRVAAKAADKDT